jgi:lysophospholipase L1-like esterase
MWGVRVSIRPEQPEPFLRGCVFPAVTDAPYPRADPAEADYLPADVWDAAQLPVGVRLEMLGDAGTIRVWYKTTRASLGYRGESAGCSFVAYRGGQKVAMADAVMGEGMVELAISGRPDLPVTVYFPEGMQPIITGVAGVEETMVPAPLQPRWLAYGDAVTQGWLASAPAMAWPAVAGRKLGLDVCNLGYAGTARGELTSALTLAETPTEVISIAFGLNNWSRVPHTVGLMSEEVRCFLSVVRHGHPEIPIVVVSPTARPDAEDSPNRVGATLAELRLAMEEAVLDSIAGGDERLFLVHGLSVVDPEHLEDGIYPGDEGHRRLAAAVSKILAPHVADLRTAAEKRWASEGTSPTSVPTPSAFHAGLVNGADLLSVGADAASSDVGSLDDDDPDVAVPKLDLPEIESLDRAALDDALLDALSPNGASPAEASSDGVSPNGVSANGASWDAAPASVDHVDTEHGEIAVPEETPPEPPVDTAPVETAPVETAPVETAPVDTAPVNAASSVDIEVADMVVAALSLATNGADEMFAEQDTGTAEELQWGEPAGGAELLWGEAGVADELQWGEAVVNGDADELQWADPGEVDGLEWSVAAEPGPA